MSTSTDGFTIGEVLTQLKEEFEDITISKIRFLESEGLVSPDRTESGYRKFTGDDIERLRFVLKAQRDHYLPLKVIRQQLERLDSGEPDSGAESTDLPATGLPNPRAQEISQAVQAAVAGGDTPLLEPGSGDVELDLGELCEATGLTVEEVRELRDYGIIGERGEQLVSFDADDVLAARAARDLLQLGLEARHLRMYRQFIEREVALFEQLANPLLHQRNPEARRLATRQLEKLSGLTGQLRRSLLARVLRGYMHGS